MCDPAGCLYELCMMLAIYMILRQVASNTMELYWPKLKNWLRKALTFWKITHSSSVGHHHHHHPGSRAARMGSDALDDDDASTSSSHASSAKFRFSDVNKQHMRRWESDYVLEELDRLHLFDEYIEMGKYF